MNRQEPTFKAGQDITLWRENSWPMTNLPDKREVIHSPDGYEWGYGGSGPADLAFNILLQFVPRGWARCLYHRFKWEVVSQIPWEGGKISAEEIRCWIDQSLNINVQPA